MILLSHSVKYSLRFPRYRGTESPNLGEQLSKLLTLGSPKLVELLRGAARVQKLTLRIASKRKES